MTGKQLLLKALRDETTPRPAWVPFVGVHGAKLIGVTAWDYLRSSERIVAGLSKAARAACDRVADDVAAVLAAPGSDD